MPRILKKGICNVFYFRATTAKPQKLIHFQCGRTIFLKCDHHNHTQSALLCNSILLCLIFLCFISMIKFGENFLHGHFYCYFSFKAIRFFICFSKEKNHREGYFNKTWTMSLDPLFVFQEWPDTGRSCQNSASPGIAISASFQPLS